MVKLNVKRPIIWASSAFMLGIAGGVFAAKNGYFTVSAVILPIILLLSFVLFDKKSRKTAVVTAMCLTAAFFYSYFVFNLRNVPDISQNETSVSASILEINKKTDDYTRFEVGDVTVDGEALSSRMLITVKGSFSAAPGDRLFVTGNVTLPNEARNSGVFDYRDYLNNDGIYYVMYVNAEDVTLTPFSESTVKSLTYHINRIKYNILCSYEKVLSKDAYGIISAISLGDKVYLDEASASLYRQTGTAHLLAISGLHVGFIVLFLSFITKFLRKNGVLHFAVNMLFVWAFIFFTGASVSAVRAGVFFTLFALGEVLKARRDIVNISFATALLMLLFNPLLLFSVSFQLSFSAVLGIGILSPKLYRFLTKKCHIPQKLSQDISLLITASVSVLPVTAYHFNVVSPLSIFSNMIVVPLFSYVMVFAMLLLAAVSVGLPFLTTALATVINGFIFIINNVLGFFSKTGIASIQVASPDITVISAIILILILLSTEKPRWIKHRFVGIAVMLFVIVADIALPFTGITGEYRVSFIDVGQAECALIVTPTNKTVMIDAGTSYGTTGTADYTVIPYVLKHGNTSIDYLVLSHPHSDHVGEAESVINGINVKNVILCYPEDSVPEEYVPILSLAEEKGIPVINMYYTDSVSVDGRTILTRATAHYSQSDVNSQSLVLNVSCGNNSLLFAGDMSADGLNKIGDIDNLLLYKVSHHGSKTGISEKIRTLSPLYGVICTKEGNSYNLPAEATLDYLQGFTEVLQTADSGEIMLRFSDGYVKIIKYFS